MEDGITEAENLLHPREANREEEEEEDDNDDKKDDDHDRGEDRPGGLINQIVSNLISKGDQADDDEEEKEEEKGGGGLLGNIISNLVSPLNAKGGTEKVVEVYQDIGGEISECEVEKERAKVDEENEEVKTEEEGGGGIIENIVSHFPCSLPDDAAPTTDEASILIHIVHD